LEEKLGMDERNTYRNTGRRLGIFAALVLIAFAVTLAVIIGDRLSDEALAVLAGAVCGVGAAIPTSLIIVAVTRRRDNSRAEPALSQTKEPYPPVVVVTPPGGQLRSEGWNGLPASLSSPVQRHFTVVGGGTDEENNTT
jgi:hypothetical protein